MSDSGESKLSVTQDLERPAAPAQQSQFAQLLKESENLALIRLSASVSVMLDKSTESLRTQADQTTDRDQRELINKTRDAVLDNRRVMEEQFRLHLQDEFRARYKRESPIKQQEKYGTDLSTLELGLVNDDDLEETLKVNDMATKLRRYCEEELAALDQRVAVLIGDANLQGDANPFSPQAVLAAFKQACRKCQPELRIRMMFLKLFDEHVLDEVRSVYRDLNALLVQHSILPKIRYSVKRPAGGGLPIGAAPAAAAMAAAAAQLAGGMQGDGESGGGEQDFFSMLQGLMVNLAGAGAAAGLVGGMGGTGAAAGLAGGMGGAGGNAPGGGAMAGPGRILQGAELLGSLTRIQQGDAGAFLAANQSLADPGKANVLRELKSSELAGGMAQMDRVTLDIVAMLFDQIFDDRKIPTAMKALIGRLQIPVLKVAILDKEFFSTKHHPAREFLDTLGEIALGLDTSFTPETALYQALDGVVQKLIDNFNDSVDLFVELHEEVKRVATEDSQHAEKAAHRFAEQIDQKEKLEVAKAIAQREIQQRAKIHSIPRVVLSFLTEHWVKLLIIAHAKNGPGSTAWKSAIQTMDLLIWSVTAKHGPEERRKLATLLPPLLKRLNMGLQVIRVEDEARRQFFAKLLRCHTKVIEGTIEQVRPSAEARTAHAGATPHTPSVESIPSSGGAALDFTHAKDAAKQAPAQPPSAAGANTTGAEIDDDIAPAEAPLSFRAVTIRNPFGEGEIDVEEISLADVPVSAGGARPDSEASSGDMYSKLVSNLKEGVWLEFRDSEDNRTQARLSHISPLKGTYLFVNRQGRKIAEHSTYQLIREFRSGSVHVIDAAPLIERAMSSLVGALRNTQATH